MIATLHHMPFVAALSAASRPQREGGVLAALGLHEHRTLVSLAHGLVAFPVSWCYRATRPTAPVGAPTRAPSMTLAQIRREAAAVLPGATVRRRLLWRYTLVWTKLSRSAPSSS